MSSLVDLYPPFGLHVVAGPLELRGLTDELLLEVCDLAERGIHDPDEMPFYFPWSTAPVGELGRNTAAYHWGKRSTFSPQDFCLDLAVLLDGQVIGCQGVAAKHFPVTRTGETGSWLGREFQGRGLGTAMRQVFCELLFDHLGFEEITSAAFLDNPASLGVSRKVGYRRDRADPGQAPRRRAAPTPAASSSRPRPSCAATCRSRSPAPTPCAPSSGSDRRRRPIGRPTAYVWQNPSSCPARPDPLIRACSAHRATRPGTPPGEGRSPTTIPEETPQTWPSRFV